MGPRRESNGERVIEWFRRVPWWIGPVVAAVVYLGWGVAAPRLVADSGNPIEASPNDKSLKVNPTFLLVALAKAGRVAAPIFAIGFLMLWAGGMLGKLLVKPEASPQVTDDRRREKSKSPVSTGHPSVPACPDCGQPMSLRTARKGEKAGQQFWGCPGYPKCRGTRPLDAVP